MRAIATMLALIIALSGCATQSATTEEIVVSAAASLTDVFTEMAHAFEANSPTIDVVLNFGGSSALREQILEGAPTDVFAAADPIVMEGIVVNNASAGAPQIFARNVLVLATPADAPASVVTLEDLSREELLVGLCAPEVPCGRLAAAVLSDRGIEAAVDTFETDVRSLRTKLELGELDAGLIYATDIADGANLRVIDIDSPDAAYPITAIAGSEYPEAAADFIAFVLGAEGQAILRMHGFAAP